MKEGTRVFIAEREDSTKEQMGKLLTGVGHTVVGSVGTIREAAQFLEDDAHAGIDVAVIGDLDLYWQPNSAIAGEFVATMVKQIAPSATIVTASPVESLPYGDVHANKFTATWPQVVLKAIAEKK